MGTIRAYLKVRESEDQLLKEAGARRNLEGAARKCAQSLGGRLPINRKQYVRMEVRTSNKDINEWADLPLQGQGVNDFRNVPVGNQWLTDIKLLKGGRLCDTIRMRTNTFGTWAVLGQTDRTINTNCRKCKDKPETLGHILGRCIHTKEARIRRHAEIKNFEAEKAVRQLTVFTEPTINRRGEVKKADLVVKREAEVVVADVTILGVRQFRYKF